jgi:hypothetical protein
MDGSQAAFMSLENGLQKLRLGAPKSPVSPHRAPTIGEAQKQLKVCYTLPLFSRYASDIHYLGADQNTYASNAMLE